MLACERSFRKERNDRRNNPALRAGKSLKSPAAEGSGEVVVRARDRGGPHG
jgi:hypothetical protein